MAGTQQALDSATSERAPRSGQRRAEWVVALLLGLLLFAGAALFTLAELAAPPLQPGFKGIKLSNAINSPGMRAGLALFRQHLGWLPFSLTERGLSPGSYLWSLRAAVLVMAAAQALAILAVLRRPPSSPWPWLAGPTVTVAGLILCPPVSTDIFSYASFGWVGHRGGNPYLAAPASLPGDPFAAMNDWTHIATPYGPLWTGVSQALVAIGREEPMATAVAFKVTTGLAALGLAFATYALARRLTGDPRLAAAALIIVAWSPVLLIESGANAHNDAPMMLLAVGGLLCLTSSRRGAFRGGLALIVAGAMIKPVVLPLFGLAVLVRLAKRNDGWLRLAGRWALDAVAAAAVVVIAFAPYWSGGKLPETLWTSERHLYFDKALKTNPLWVWAPPELAYHLIGEGARKAVKAHVPTLSRVVVAVALLAALALALRPVLRRGVATLLTAVRQSQAPAWAMATVAMGLLPINTHAWYAIWSLPAVGLAWVCRSAERPRRWIIPYLAWVLLVFLVYHTWA